MSHFTVLVIGDDVEGKLAPFDENLEVEPYKVYYDEESIAHMVSHYNEREGYNLDKNDLQALVPLMKEWGGYDKAAVDNDGLHYWSTYNPDSKWDWYQIGGRWRGQLLLKHGTTGVQGEASFMLANPIYPLQSVDQANFGDIDWGYMQYNPMTIVEWATAWKRIMSGSGMVKPAYLKKKYPGGVKEYVRKNMRFSTYAVITEDGKWNAPGEMGMWAMSSETDEEDELWQERFWEGFLEGLAPDTLITVVDCHI